MAYPTDRLMLFDKDGNTLGDLAPDEVFARVRTEEINGIHELNLVTSRLLSRDVRVLTVDATGKWREYVIYKPDDEHAEGKRAFGIYTAMWSLQYDLMGAYADEHAEPGMGSSCAAAAAVAAALDGQARWTVGTVDVGPVAKGNGCVMIGISAWERLSLVVEHWGGEVDAQIAVDSSGVTSRAVAFRAHLGSTTATRRFDWAHDLTRIKRIPDEGPYYCRVVPLGNGQREYAEDDETQFEWPVGIEEENGGVSYIEDATSALAFRTKNPDGTYHYPTKVVHYDQSDPELLLAAANDDLHNHTRPGVSYEAEVLQFVEAGMDVQGVQLGDNTQCADYGFSPDAPLAIEGRVQRMEVDELAPKTNTKLTIGSLGGSFADVITSLVGTSTQSFNSRLSNIERGGTIAYLENLLDELNSAINATGGYSYLVPGEGLLTYDVAVSDPSVGAEASQVVQIKGGSIRIANTRTSSGAWKWETVFVSGKIAASLVVAAHLTAGYIGSPSSDNYWNLDTGEHSVSGDAVEVGGTQYLDGTANWAGWRKGGNWSFDVSGGVATCSAKNSVSNWNDMIASPLRKLKYTALRGHKVTISFEAISDDSWGADSSTNRLYARVALIDSASTDTRAYIDRTFNLSTTWTRYKATIPLADANFTRTGNIQLTDLTGYTMELRIYNRSKHRVRMRKVKLERGRSATDWCTSSGDAKAYAASIAKSEAQAINNSLNAEKVFNKLTNNGAIKCIKRDSSGNLWINATWIESNTLKAEMIRAGILADKAGKVAINLNTGAATLKALTAANATVSGRIFSGKDSGARMEIRDGGLTGYFGKKVISTINTAGAVVDELVNKKKRVRGLGIHTGGTIQLDSPSIFVQTSGTGGRFGGVPVPNISGFGFTGDIRLKNVTFNMNSKMTSCKTGDVYLTFANGILVGVTGTSGLLSTSRQKPKYESAVMYDASSVKSSSGSVIVIG